MRENNNKNLPVSYINIIRDKSLTTYELVNKVLKMCNNLSYDETKMCIDELNKYLNNKLYISSKESSKLIKDAQTKNIGEIGFTTITNVVDNEKNDILIKVQNNIEVNSDFVMFIVETCKKMIEMYPTSVGLKEIRLHETFCPDDYEIANRMNLDTFSSSATTNYRSGVINLWGISSLKKEPLILYHEYAHLIANDLSKYDYELDSDYKEAVELDNNIINEYTKNDLSEDFAESYALCFLDREKFRKKYSNRYNVLINRVKTLEKNEIVK